MICHCEQSRKKKKGKKRVRRKMLKRSTCINFTDVEKCTRMCMCVCVSIFLLLLFFFFACRKTQTYLLLQQRRNKTVKHLLTQHHVA